MTAPNTSTETPAHIQRQQRFEQGRHHEHLSSGTGTPGASPGREAAAVMAFSAATSVGLAAALLILTSLGQ